MKTEHTLKSIAYHRIKEKILFGYLKPSGVIDQKLLAKEMDLGSITPVREALLQLQNEGLITILPRKGIFVSDIPIEDVMNNYQVREVLEPPFLIMAAPFITKDFITQYQTTFRQFQDSEEAFNYEKYLDVDMNFHLELLSPLQNTTLNHILRGIYEQNVRYRMLSLQKRQSVVMVSEHLEILNALDKKEEQKAAELLRQHTVNSKSALLSDLNII